MYNPKLAPTNVILFPSVILYSRFAWRPFAFEIFTLKAIPITIILIWETYYDIVAWIAEIGKNILRGSKFKIALICGVNKLTFYIICGVI